MSELGQQDEENTTTTAAAAETAFELLWINERKTDFILSEELEELEAKHPEQLYVARVLDTALGDAEAQVNDKLRSALAPHEAGRVAIVLGPEQITTKATGFLEALGYSEDSLCAIPVD